jgi:hypothetical protein
MHTVYQLLFFTLFIEIKFKTGEIIMQQRKLYVIQVSNFLKRTFLILTLTRNVVNHFILNVEPQNKIVTQHIF